MEVVQPQAPVMHTAMGHTSGLLIQMRIQMQQKRMQIQMQEKQMKWKHSFLWI